MTARHLLLTILVAALVSWGAVYALRPDTTATTAAESTYDRVTRTNTLRCGYASWYPNLMIDPNTRQFSGISYDVMQEVGRRLGLTIEWTQEAGFSSAEQDLKVGKYDVLCADVCFEAHRNRHASFSRPFRQDPIYLISRADDARFTNSIAAANDAGITMANYPGMVIESYAKAYIPNAQRIDVNALGAEGDLMMAIMTKKADVSFNNLISVDLFNKKNGPSIQVTRPAVAMCNGSFMLPHGDAQLKSLIDGALDEMIAEGVMPAIYKKYLPDSPDYWRTPQSLLRGRD